ncbi:MAG: response regulator [Alphaproteobacteria bacterium]|nr:response regulator [Alphaproteobacteria bacterium]
MKSLEATAEYERRRLAALWALDILDTFEDPGFNNLVAEVSETCGAPMALISLVDADRQWFKAKLGIEIQQTPRDIAFCDHAIRSASLFVIEDATLDARFAENPLVTGQPGVRAYAGAPLTTVDGLRIGTLCAMDTQPKIWTPRELRCLERLSRVAMMMIEARVGANIAGSHARDLENLRRGDQQYRMIIAAMREGVVLQDRASVIIEHNANAARLLGLTSDQLVGRSSLDPSWSLVDVDGLPLAVDQQPSMQCLATGKPVLDFILGVNLPQDGRRWLTVNALPIFEDDGPEPAKTLTTFADITQLKLQEAQLIETAAVAERASAAKSTFVANVSHEIRTPLNGVIGLAKLLSRQPMPDRQREMVDIIVHSGETLERILNDLLDIGKIEASRMELEVAPFDLRAEIQTCTDLMRLRAEGKGVKFDLVFAPDIDGFYLGDALRLRQVVSNLTANAIKFTDRGAVQVRVEVHAALPDAADRRLTVTVDDTGIGLAPEILPRLFERFVQGDDTVTRRFGGTGLGLAICRNLVALMGGQIDAQAREGGGSRFCFTIPLRLAPPSAAAPAITENDPRALMPDRAPRILLVEDHPVNRRVVELLLEPLQVSLTMAENGAEAFDRVRQEGFDLVLMDMQMPVMDGLSATTRIRQWEAREGRAPTPIVMMTANASADYRRQALAVGADGFITKPVTPESLYAGIDAALSPSPAAATA